MKARITNTLVLLLIITGYSTYAQEQEFSKNSIKVGVGIGSSMGNSTEGFGPVYTIGYQREIWNARFRLNPNFSIGNYSSKLITDTRDLYFNSISLEANLYYDLIKTKSFSIVLGWGGFANNSRGLKGTGGDPDGYTKPPGSEYVSDFHFGGYLGGGFRINSANKRTAVNIMPINIRAGSNEFAELHAKIELDIKL